MYRADLSVGRGDLGEERTVWALHCVSAMANGRQRPVDHYDLYARDWGASCGPIPLAISREKEDDLCPDVMFVMVVTTVVGAGVGAASAARGGVVVAQWCTVKGGDLFVLVLGSEGAVEGVVGSGRHATRRRGRGGIHRHTCSSIHSASTNDISLLQPLQLGGGWAYAAR